MVWLFHQFFFFAIGRLSSFFLTDSINFRTHLYACLGNQDANHGCSNGYFLILTWNRKIWSIINSQQQPILHPAILLCSKFRLFFRLRLFRYTCSRNQRRKNYHNRSAPNFWWYSWTLTICLNSFHFILFLLLFWFCRSHLWSSCFLCFGFVFEFLSIQWLKIREEKTNYISLCLYTYLSPPPSITRSMRFIQWTSIKTTTEKEIYELYICDRVPNKKKIAKIKQKYFRKWKKKLNKTKIKMKKRKLWSHSQ